MDVNAAAHACRVKLRKMLQRVPCALMGACVALCCALLRVFLHFVKTAQTFSVNIYSRKINKKRRFFECANAVYMGGVVGMFRQCTRSHGGCAVFADATRFARGLRSAYPRAVSVQNKGGF